jgi:very-short-patch-repair endonuclease
VRSGILHPICYSRDSMKYRYQYNKKFSNFSQSNRKSPTDAEKQLWYRLRNRQLAGFKFRRQYPIDRFILDFYCLEKQLGVELDGSQHIEAKDYDDNREAFLHSKGITVLRFWDNEVLVNTEGVLTRILEHLHQTSS